MQTAILMCTYNGEKYLAEQLDSIRAQTHGDWKLYVSDDASTDATMDILREYQHAWGAEKLSVTHNNPRKGYCRNFLTLTASQDIVADFYFWTDQDDLWLPNKIARALPLLRDNTRPTLCGGPTILINAAGEEIGLSSIRNKRPKAFANALLQSMAGGNTMAFNRPARELIALGAPFQPTCHDWWAYLAVSGAGGQVIYDTEPTLKYRQHGANQIGDNQGLNAKLTRLTKLLDGEYRRWNEDNLGALQAFRKHLTPQNNNLLNSFIELRNSPNPLKRLQLFTRLGLYREDTPGHLAMMLAAFLGRI